MQRSSAILFLGMLGCASQSPTENSDPKTPALAHTRLIIESADLHGASGMDRGPQGHLFAVLERDHRLFELSVGASSVTVVGARSVVGAPSAMDLESMAFIDDTHVAFGTETTNTDRTGDLILFGELHEDKVLVSEERLTLEYAPWGLTPERNRGIEGLCHVAGTLVAAVETSGMQDKQRFAPVATFDLTTKAWQYYRVALTSETGKVAALTCRQGPEGIEVMAIERHYEISRILQFTLPKVTSQQQITPTILADMSMTFGKSKIPNFEGLVVLGTGQVAAISDNDYGGITGPTELLLLPAPGGTAEP